MARIASIAPDLRPALPAFGRLRVRGLDPVLGVSRSFLLKLDAKGELPLVRLSAEGHGRPVVLIDYEAAVAHFRRAGQPLARHAS